MKITTEESPYGDSGAVYDGMLGMMQHYILQLKSFRSPKKTKEESEHLEADIAGYEEVLKSGSEKNAEMFMQTKHRSHVDGIRIVFKNNLEVVQYLKSIGRWR